MSRVRVSTTVDAARLEQARRLVGEPDSRLLDQALAALVNERERAQEEAALDAHPYEADPELHWEVPAGPDLAYDGAIPSEVLELAAERRKRRRR